MPVQLSPSANGWVPAPGELDHVVELAVLGASQERGDLRARVDERGPGWEPGIPHRDLPVRQVRDLNACAVGVAVLALLPGDVRQFCGRYTIIDVAHVPSSDCIVVVLLENLRRRHGRRPPVAGPSMPRADDRASSFARDARSFAHAPDERASGLASARHFGHDVIEAYPTKLRQALY